MNKKKFTYKKSGVDINAADSFIKFISNVSSSKCTCSCRSPMASCQFKLYDALDMVDFVVVYYWKIVTGYCVLCFGVEVREKLIVLCERIRN